jgi:glycerate kinase
MTGCAGGLSGGLWAGLGATLTPGAAYVLDAVGFDARAAAASAVVTGEGRLDGQTLAGKLIGEIAERSRRAGVPLHAIVGSTALAPDQLAQIALAGVQVASTLAEIEGAGERLGQTLGD